MYPELTSPPTTDQRVLCGDRRDSQRGARLTMLIQWYKLRERKAANSSPARLLGACVCGDVSMTTTTTPVERAPAHKAGAEPSLDGGRDGSVFNPLNRAARDKELAG